MKDVSREYRPSGTRKISAMDFSRSRAPLPKGKAARRSWPDFRQNEKNAGRRRRPLMVSSAHHRVSREATYDLMCAAPTATTFSGLSGNGTKRNISTNRRGGCAEGEASRPLLSCLASVRSLRRGSGCDGLHNGPCISNSTIRGNFRVRAWG